MESGFFPAGAKHDPNAPWNQEDIEERECDVNYSCMLHRTAAVSTTDYIPGFVEYDEDGAYSTGDDFSRTDWIKEFSGQHYTPADLIALLRGIATELAEGRTPQKGAGEWRRIAANCEGWEVEDEYAEEEI